jgi:hypothetical protein
MTSRKVFWCKTCDRAVDAEMQARIHELNMGHPVARSVVDVAEPMPQAYIPGTGNVPMVNLRGRDAREWQVVQALPGDLPYSAVVGDRVGVVGVGGNFVHEGIVVSMGDGFQKLGVQVLGVRPPSAERDGEGR